MFFVPSLLSVLSPVVSLFKQATLFPSHTRFFSLGTALRNHTRFILNRQQHRR